MGVVVSRNGSTPQTVKAHKEVIVSAGVIGSAQLLMLSGIGPSQHLTDLKVCVCAFAMNFTVVVISSWRQQRQMIPVRRTLYRVFSVHKNSITIHTPNFNEKFVGKC